MTSIAVRRVRLPFWPAVGGSRLAHRLVRGRPLCRMVRVRPAGPAAGPTSGTRSPSSPTTCPRCCCSCSGSSRSSRSSAASSRPRRCAARSRARGVRRDRRGGQPRHRHALLLLLGGAPVHRLRRGRNPRGHLRLPDQLAHGERDRPRPAVGPVRAGDRPVYMAAGLLVAIVGGLVIGKLHMERYVEDYVWALQGTGGRRSKSG